MKLKFLTLATFFLSLPVCAQLTLDECQRLARENYPLLHKYDLVRQTTDYTLKNISKGYLPQITAQAQATWQSDVPTLPDALTATMAQGGSRMKGLENDQYRIGVDVSQTLYDGGSIKAKARMAEAEGEVAERQTDTEMYALYSRVNELYFGILLLDERLLLNAELQKLLEDNCRLMEAHVRGGTAMQSDADALRAELMSTRQDGTALVTMRRSCCDMLALFIGKEVNGLLVKPEESLPNTAENHRPELRLFDAKLRQTEAQRQLIDAGLRPKVSFFAQGYYGYPGMDMFHDMASHDWTLNGLIGVRVAWNISNFYTRKNDRARLDLAILQTENAREVFLFNNRLTSTQQQALIAQYRKMLTEDDNIISLRHSVRTAAEARLTHGTFDVNDLLRELTRENQARINRSVHEVEMLKAIHELRETLGAE